MGVLSQKGTGKVYYCKLCKDSIFLAKNFLMNASPQRSLDGTIVIDETINDLLTTCREGETVLINRTDGYEKQTRIHCKTCNVTIGYHLKNQYLYILQDALIE